MISQSYFAIKIKLKQKCNQAQNLKSLHKEADISSYLKKDFRTQKPKSDKQYKMQQGKILKDLFA